MKLVSLITKINQKQIQHREFAFKMNPDGSISSSKLLGPNNKFLKRFNSKINVSTFQLFTEDSQPVQKTIYEPPIHIKERQKSPLRHKPIISKYISHIGFVQNKLQDHQKMVETLLRQNEQKSIQLQKLKRNYEIVKQENISLESKNFELQTLSTHLSEQLEIAKKKIVILQLQFQDKINQSQYKLNEMQQNSTSRTFLKRGRSKAKDTNSVSCSQIQIYTSQENPEIVKSSHKEKQERLYQILSQNSTQSQKSFINLQNLQEKTNLCIRLEQEIIALKQKVKSLHEKQKELTSQNQKIKASLQKINAKNEAQTSLNVKLRLQAKSFEEKIDQLARNLSKQRQEKNLKINELQKLEDELNSIEQSHQITKKCYQEEIENLNTKITQLAILIQQQPKKQRQYQNNQLLKKIQLIEELEQEKEKLENLFKGLKSKDEKRQRELVQIKKLYESVKNEHQKLTKQKETLNRQLNTLQHTYDKKDKVIKELKDDIHSLQKKVQQEKESVSKEIQKQQALKKQNQDLKDALEQKIDEIKKVKIHLKALEEKILSTQLKAKQIIQSYKEKDEIWEQKQREIEDLRKQVNEEKELILKQSLQHKTELQSYKKQCEQVVTNLSTQLQQALSKEQTSIKSNNDLTNLLKNMHEQCTQKQHEIDLLKQQIENLKQLFQQEKMLLEQQLKDQISKLAEEKDRSIQKLSSEKQIEIKEKQIQWKEKMDQAQKDKMEVIEELEAKIKQLEQKIEFMEEQNNIKEEEVINLINEKNSIIENKETKIKEKQQQITLLKKSSLNVQLHE